jgi:AAA+ ATPase superfamily predicted ATPase
MEPVLNPFITSGYIGADYFCDRQEETRLLLSHIKNNNNVTLFALRRLGKTGLIQHVFSQLATSKQTACIYIDIFPTTNLKEFTNRLATAIYSRFPEKKGIGQRFLSFIKLLRPVFSYDALTGNPEVTLDLGQPKEYEKTIQQLFAFLDTQSVKIVIAIDEFQQITTYPEKNVEALLRTYMQQLKNTRFIFCGSNQRIMTEMFANAKRPFYGSCINMSLDFINQEHYSAFISTHFKQKGRRITKEAVDFILEFTQSHTYYTQLLCNQIFATNNRKVTLENVRAICASLLAQNENTWYQYRSLLTKAQWNLLTAIAKEEKVTKPHASQFIKKYDLDNASLIKRGLEALLTKEMVYYYTQSKEPFYAVYDKFLMRWLQ